MDSHVDAGERDGERELPQHCERDDGPIPGVVTLVKGHRAKEGAAAHQHQGTDGDLENG